MKLYLASDHAGFALKTTLIAYLRGVGHEVENVGPFEFAEHDDYPDFCIPCAQKVVADVGSKGVISGLSGQGEAMAANRVVGARAAVYYGGPEEILQLSRQHNDANILSLGAGFLSPEDAERVVAEWLSTPFSGEERHVRRIQKLDHV